MKTIVRALDERGLDGTALAAGVGIDVGNLDGDGRAPQALVERLWKEAVGATADPAFGLFAATFVTPATFHGLGFAVVASPTFGAALARTVRYYRLINDNDSVDASIEEASDRATLRVDVRPASEPVPEAIDAMFALVVVMARRQLGGAVDPAAVSLRRSEPPRSDPYTELFRVPVEFGALQNRLEFSRDVFDLPMPAPSEEFSRSADAVLAGVLERLDDSPVRKIQSIIAENLADGLPPQERVARLVGMSARTMQRRLSEEGTSYHQLVEDARRELALSYVREGTTSVTEMAFLLGYTSVSAFSRAFKGWTGRSPRQYANENA